MDLKKAIQDSVPFLEELSSDLEVPMEQVIQVFERNFKRITSSPQSEGLPDLVIVRHVQVDTEDELCAQEEPTGEVVEGILTCFLSHIDNNAKEIRKIKNKMKTEDGLNKLKDKGIVREVDGKDVIYDTRKFFPRTTIENPNWNKPLLPNYKLTVSLLGSNESNPDDIKERQIVFYGDLADPESPYYVSSTIEKMMGKAVKITGLFQSKKSTDELPLYGASDKDQVKILPVELNLPSVGMFVLQLQLEDKVYPSEKFIRLADKEAWYEGSGTVVTKAGKREAFNQWTFIGKADDPAELSGVRVTKISLGTGKQWDKLFVRDNSLPREKGSYETIDVPPSIKIKDEDGNPIISKGSKILPAVKIRRRDTVYDPNVGQFVKGEGPIYFQLVGYLVIQSTAPSKESAPKNVKYEDVDLDEL